MRKAWAKRKAEKLGNVDSIHFGNTHASFITEKENGEFSAIQIKYPDSIFGVVFGWAIRIFVIVFWILLGAGIGFMIGAIINEEGILMKILAVVGAILGGFYGFTEAN